MARISDPLAVERPSPQAPGGIVQMPATSVGPVGQGAEQAGQNVVAGSNEIYAAQKVEQERLNSMVAESAINKYRTSAMDLQTNPDNGYLMVKGQDVIDKPIYDEWNKKLDDSRASISAGLTNDFQRNEFQRRADATTVQFNEGLGRHIAEQTDVAYKQTYEGTKEVETRNAIQNWNSPPLIESSLLRIQDGVDTMAEHFRWPQEMRDATLLMDQGAVNKEIVQTAIANGNYEYAQKWATDHQDNMDLRTRKYLEVALREGKQKEAFNGFTADYLANMKDPQYLETLLTKVQKDPDLDDARVNMLTYRIQRQQDSLAKAAATEAEKQKRIILGNIDDVNKTVALGYVPTPAQMQGTYDSAQGDPELKAAANEMVRRATAVRAFSQSAPLDQERYLAAAQATARSDPLRYDLPLLSSMTTIAANQKAQIAADPADFAVRQGMVPPSVIDVSKMADQGQALRDRFLLIRGMKGPYNAPDKPLTVAEVNQVSSMLKNAPAAVKTKFYGDLSAAAGSDDLGRTGYSQVMGQLAKDDPVTAVAGEYMGKKRQTAAYDMIAGQAILHPARASDGSPDQGKLWPMPPEKDMDMAAADYEGTAFAGHPELSNAFHQSAKAIYAKRISDLGDKSGVLNTDVWNDSMRAANGGIETYHGTRLLMPYGMAKSEFKDALALRVQGLVPDAPPPAAAAPTRDLLTGQSLTQIAFDKRFDTKLTRDQEDAYFAWIDKVSPHDSGVDYDYRGAFKAGVTPTDAGQGMHWPDTFKKPNHPTFSVESKYANFGNPGHWEGEKFVPGTFDQPPAPPPPAKPQPHGGLDPKVTRDVLMGLPLEPIADGRYAFRSGTKILTYRDGTPITVDFNQPASSTLAPPPKNPATSPATTGPRPSEDVR